MKYFHGVCVLVNTSAALIGPLGALGKFNIFCAVVGLVLLLWEGSDK